MSMIDYLVPPVGFLMYCVDIAVWRMNNPYDAMWYDLEKIEEEIFNLYAIKDVIRP